MFNLRASRTFKPIGARRGDGLAIALVIAGLALAVGPTLSVQLLDRIVAGIQQAEVAQWMRAHPAAGPSAQAAVIEPGPDGYLLEIPKIGVRVIVHELEPSVFAGRNTPTLKHYGVGQIPFTEDLRNVSPGAAGTAAIAGHRTTSGAPLRNIDRLGPGDLIIIRKGPAAQRWEVVYATAVVPSQAEAIRSQSGVSRLAVLACNPPFSARERIVVYARRIPG